MTNTSENNISLLSSFSFEIEILQVLTVDGFSGFSIFQYASKALKNNFSLQPFYQMCFYLLFENFISVHNVFLSIPHLLLLGRYLEEAYTYMNKHIHEHAHV